MVTGIIAEYNPFHNGHKYMLNKINNMDANEGTVICMSGSITQRGELAVLNKWQRAEVAVQNGANLVIELPTVFSARSAEVFAQGGVNLLSTLGIVDTLAFGTKYPNLTLLHKAAEFQPDLYSEELQKKLKSGLSYGSAVSQLRTEKLHLPEELLREPNTILGIEYLRAIKALSDNDNPTLKPLPIMRKGAAHNDITARDEFASGTALRSLIYENKFTEIADFVPSALMQKLDKTTTYPSTVKLFELLRYQLLTVPVHKLAEICGVNEGLEYKLHDAAACTSLSELIAKLAGRRYPATRIQRILVHILLNIKQAYAISIGIKPLYIRVLAFDEIGRKMLKKIRVASPLPLITKTSAHINRLDMRNPAAYSPLQQMLALDIAASNLREICCAELSGNSNSANNINLDLTTSPVYVKK